MEEENTKCCVCDREFECQPYNCSECGAEFDLDCAITEWRGDLVMVKCPKCKTRVDIL